MVPAFCPLMEAPIACAQSSIRYTFFSLQKSRMAKISSVISPAKCTTMIAFVLSEIFFSIESGSAHQFFSSISQKTGVALQYVIGAAVAVQFKSESIISSPSLIFKEVEGKLDFDWKEIFELFKKPNVRREKIVFPKPDESKVRKVLVEEHDFSLERVEKQLSKLRDAKRQEAQRTLF